MLVVKELHQVGAQYNDVAEKFNVPRSTLHDWEKQLARKDKKVTHGSKGVHLKSGSGQQISYPKEIDDENLEWVLVRWDSHLPVSTDLIKAKALKEITSHNPNFKASNGWLQKFMF